MADDDPQNNDNLAQTSHWAIVGVFSVLFLVIVTPCIRQRLSLFSTNADKKALDTDEELGLDKKHTPPVMTI